MRENFNGNYRSRVFLLLMFIYVFHCTYATTDTEEVSPSIQHRHESHGKTVWDCSSYSSNRESWINYDYLLHCTPLKESKMATRFVLGCILALLLYLLSSTADEFFCPVLQSIVETYQIPPDVAGVTFLTFGNGSPDVFSNIAAFKSATPKIGVSSIVGAGLLVTTVIVASVGLASQGQEQLKPRKFIRDIGFYFIAVFYFFLVCMDGSVNLMEALVFLVIYMIYVMIVLLDHRIDAFLDNLYMKRHQLHSHAQEKIPIILRDITSAGTPIYYSAPEIENYHSDSSSGQIDLHIPIESKRHSFRGYTSSDSDPADPFWNFPQRKASAPTPRSMFLRNHTRSTDVTLLDRPASVCDPANLRKMSKRQKYIAAIHGKHAPSFKLTAMRWTRNYRRFSYLDRITEFSRDFDNSFSGEKMSGYLEQDEQVQESSNSSHDREEKKKSWKTCWVIPYFVYDILFLWIWQPFATLLTFIRRLTIPLVDEDTWSKPLVLLCFPVATFMLGITFFNANIIHDMWFVIAIGCVGGLGSLYIAMTSTMGHPPKGYLLAPLLCLAFAMSVTWIMEIANETLFVVKLLGKLFGVSNSVLGVSVLAWGNSIGDLVSNTAIARDGFPTMAFAGCFAGPMFNLLVGIGLAMVIAILSNGKPVHIGHPTQLEYLGFGYLFCSLLLNFGVATLHRYEYRPSLCYSLLMLYTSFVVISVMIVWDDSSM